MAWDLSTKDVITIIVIPIAIALIGVFWPLIQSRFRKSRFTKLILRELSEASPYPKQPIPNSRWSDHMKEQFLHRRIFADPSTNKDLILSLDSDFAYKVGQLWSALTDNDDEQWLHYMRDLATGYRKKEPQLSVVYGDWQRLINAYARPTTAG